MMVEISLSSHSSAWGRTRIQWGVKLAFVEEVIYVGTRRYVVVLT